jgi:hypothetical protein
MFCISFLLSPAFTPFQAVSYVTGARHIVVNAIRLQRDKGDIAYTVYPVTFVTSQQFTTGTP